MFVGVRQLIDMYQHIVEDSGYRVVGILDQYYWGNTEHVKNIPIIGSELELLEPNNRWIDKYDFALTSWWSGESFLGRHGLNNEQIRKDRIKLLRDVGARCPTIIHPSVNFRGRRENVNIGTGTVISSDCTFGTDITIGDFCFLDWNTSIYTDVNIGDNVITGAVTNISHCDIGDNVRLGVLSSLMPIGQRQNSKMTVGENAVIWAGVHAYRDVPAKHMWTKGDRILRRLKT